METAGSAVQGEYGQREGSSRGAGLEPLPVTRLAPRAGQRRGERGTRAAED